MKNNRMIEIHQELDSLRYDTGIEIKIIKENFDYPDCWCKLTASQFDVIMMNDSRINRECLLMAFLYINSYIGNRPRNQDGSEAMDNPETKPEAFWRSIESMAKELAMSKDTIRQCIDYLTTSTRNRDALFIKRELGSVQPAKNKLPRNVPNIYVLNKSGYQQEIEWAICKILEVRGVEQFGAANKTCRCTKEDSYQ